MPGTWPRVELLITDVLMPQMGGRNWWNACKRKGTT